MNISYTAKKPANSLREALYAFSMLINEAFASFDMFRLCICFSYKQIAVFTNSDLSVELLTSPSAFRYFIIFPPTSMV